MRNSGADAVELSRDERENVRAEQQHGQGRAQGESQGSFVKDSHIGSFVGKCG